MAVGMAVVTGASSGLGRELARECAAHGLVPILIARSVEGLTRTAAMMPDADPVIIAADLAAEPERAAEQVLRAVELRAGTLCAILNNAGTGKQGDFKATGMQHITAQLRLNLEAVLRFSHVLLPELTAGGCILNVASTAGLCPGPGMAVYYASKAGLISWSRALEFELKPCGIRVTTFCPGPLQTDFVAKAGVKERSYLLRAPRPEQAARIAVRRMLGRGGMLVYPLKFRLLGLLQRLVPMSLSIAMVQREQRRRSKVPGARHE